MKQITKLLLMGFVIITSLNAKEILFNLNAQDFSNVIEQKEIMTRYKVSDKIILETNIDKSSKGYYYIGDDTKKGKINIEINTKISNWQYKIDIIYGPYSDNTERFIIFTDKFGKDIILKFYENGFIINGKKYKSDIDGERMLINIQKEANTLNVLIDNQKIYTAPIEFGDLKLISTDVNFDASYEHKWDKLNNIVLISND